MSGSLIVDSRRIGADPLALRRELLVDDLGVMAASVDRCLTVDLAVAAVAEDFVVQGRVIGTWRGECRRCLGEVTGTIEVSLHEVFEVDPTEGETWPIVADHLDLTPVVREAALLALPLAPLCSPDCSGPEPARFPTGPALDRVASGAAGRPGRDPRWDVLDQLRLGD